MVDFALVKQIILVILILKCKLLTTNLFFEFYNSSCIATVMAVACPKSDSHPVSNQIVCIINKDISKACLLLKLEFPLIRSLS